MSGPLSRVREFLRPWYLRWFYFRAFPGRRPEAFTRCWDTPWRRLKGAGDLADLERGLPLALLFPLTGWHPRIQRSQQLARALARRGTQAVFLNPHLGRQFDSLWLADPWPRLAEVEPGVLEYHPRLPREPVFHARRLRAAESRRIVEGVRLLAGALEPARAFQLVSFPVWGEACLELRKICGWPIVYDCHDLLSGFGNVAPELVEAEVELMRRADRVLFSSDWLRDYHLNRAPELEAKSRVVRNATDLMGGPRAERRQARPVVGYVGAIEAWFDVEAVARAAAANPDCDFLLAGRVEHPGAVALGRLANVRLLGEVDRRELPALLARFDVALIPFVVNDLTRAANPIKLYEYFAFGLPVVSSSLPETLLHPELVYTAADPEAFARLVTEALRESGAEPGARRRAIAARENWDQRAAAILDTIRS